MRCLASWLLYILGDSLYRLHRAVGFSAPLSLYLYAVYNRIMAWSSVMQGPTGSGPWHAMTGDGGTAV